MWVFSLWKKIGKTTAAALLFLFFIILSDKIGSGLYQWLEQKQMGLLYQYATDGQFSDDIFFSEETEERFQIPSSLPGVHLDSGLAQLSRQVIEKQWEIAGFLEDNQEYAEYLREQGTSLSGLFAFCERIADLQNHIIYACRYVLFLLWVIILHLFMRCRPALYFAMGLLCILATCIKLSGKLSAVILFTPFSSNEFVIDGILSPLLEAMLTFLIFDITIASMEKFHLGRRIEALYQDLPALQCLIVFLAKETEFDCCYQTDISRLLPHFSAYLRYGKRGRKRAIRLIRAIESLSKPHTNRTFLEAAVELQTLLPGR